MNRNVAFYQRIKRFICFIRLVDPEYTRENAHDGAFSRCRKDKHWPIPAAFPSKDLVHRASRKCTEHAGGLVHEGLAAGLNGMST